MLNYYELIKVIGVENTDAVSAIRESFRNDWLDTFNGIQINKTTRKNALKAYTNHKNFMQDKEVKGVYSDGYTFISVSEKDAIYTTSRSCELVKQVLDVYKTAKPVEVHIKESYAIAKNLGWSAGTNDKNKPYYIEVEGNFFNFSLVWSMFSMIADNSNKWHPVDVKIGTSNKPGQNMLIMQSKYGMVGVLPFFVGERGSYQAHNVDYNFYMESENELDSLFIEYCKKSA